MIMKGKDDSENRTEREERERRFSRVLATEQCPERQTGRRANEGRRWSATGKGAQIFVMVVVDMIMTNFSNI